MHKENTAHGNYNNQGTLLAKDHQQIAKQSHSSSILENKTYIIPNERQKKHDQTLIPSVAPPDTAVNHNITGNTKQTHIVPPTSTTSTNNQLSSTQNIKNKKTKNRKIVVRSEEEKAINRHTRPHLRLPEHQTVVRHRKHALREDTASIFDSEDEIHTQLHKHKKYPHADNQDKA